MGDQQSNSNVFRTKLGGHSDAREVTASFEPRHTPRGGFQQALRQKDPLSIPIEVRCLQKERSAVRSRM